MSTMIGTVSDKVKPTKMFTEMKPEDDSKIMHNTSKGVQKIVAKYPTFVISTGHKWK